MDMTSCSIRDVLEKADTLLYLEIYEDVEAALSADGILGRPLRGNSGRGKTARALNRVANAHPDLFRDRRDKELLLEFARRCNRNARKLEKRRRDYNRRHGAANCEGAQKDNYRLGDTTLDPGYAAKAHQQEEGAHAACVETGTPPCLQPAERDRMEPATRLHETNPSEMQQQGLATTEITPSTFR